MHFVFIKNNFSGLTKFEQDERERKYRKKLVIALKEKKQKQNIEYAAVLANAHLRSVQVTKFADATNTSMNK